jgi:hypothetical protein
MIICVAFSGCGRKPSYEGMNVNASQPQVASKESPAAQPGLGTANTAAPPAPPAASTPLPEPPKAVMPSFLDQRTGNIRDIPKYPNGQVVGVMHGPQEGHNTMRITMQTGDNVETIVAYYEKAAKSNGWKIVNKRADTETGELDFEKGEKDKGGIRVQRDAQSNAVTIFIARAEKADAAK